MSDLLKLTGIVLLAAPGGRRNIFNDNPGAPKALHRHLPVFFR